MGLLSGVTDTLFGGSKQKSSSGLDPRIFDLFEGNFQRAQDTADNLQARQFAGFTPDFQAGADQIRNTVGGPGTQTLNGAVGAAQQAGNFQPSQVTPGSFLQGGLDQFQNPFTDQVVDRTLSDLDRARQITQQGIGDQAARAGAFGGSRQGVAEAETNRAFADQAATTSAGLRSQGFNTAAGLQQQDFNRNLQGQLANQQAGLQGAGLRLQGAGLQGALGAQQQQLGLQGAEALQNLGLAQQGLSQQRLDAIRNLPLEQQQLLNQTLGINPAGGAGNRSSSRGSSSPGLLGGAGDFLGNFISP